MKRTLLPILAAIFCLGLAQAHASFFDEIKGDLTGPEVKTTPKYTALYFSAHWCPPCRMFTPVLVEWYTKFKPGHPDFELVFVSADRDAESMQNYIKEAGMPWPAVAFDKARGETFMRYAASGIPYLVLIDAEGKAVTGNPDNEWLPPTQVLKEIERIVGGS